MTEEPMSAIDSSIEALEKYIEHNRRAGQKVMMYLIVFSMVIFIAAFPYLSFLKQPESPPYALMGVFIVVFGVLMAVYRFHLNEIARAGHNKNGFMCIRVAANNFDKEGFHSEVRQFLTERAFDYTLSSLIGSKGKKYRKPSTRASHSDMSTIILNKLSEGIECEKKQ
jgi:hypothetical protein